MRIAIVNYLTYRGHHGRHGLRVEGSDSKRDRCVVHRVDDGRRRTRTDGSGDWGAVVVCLSSNCRCCGDGRSCVDSATLVAGASVDGVVFGILVVACWRHAVVAVQSHTNADVDSDYCRDRLLVGEPFGFRAFAVAVSAAAAAVGVDAADQHSVRDHIRMCCRLHWQRTSADFVPRHSKSAPISMRALFAYSIAAFVAFVAFAALAV